MLLSNTLDTEMNDTRPARRYRVGVFEADVILGELRRQGTRVRLNAQPFQVLCMLLERPGQLLTREEISRELWPDGTFVDYDHGVNSAVNRIREALGDTAGSSPFGEAPPPPRFSLRPPRKPTPRQTLSQRRNAAPRRSCCIRFHRDV